MGLLGFGLRRMSTVFLECAGQRKFTQTMAHHVFRNEHRVEDLAVMNVERQPDKIRRDHRTARPGFDRSLRLGVLSLLNLGQQMVGDKRTFFNGASHISLALLHRAAVPADDDKSVGALLLVASLVALGKETPRRGQLLPATTGFRFAGAATIRVVDRISGNTTVNRANAPMTRTPRLAQDDVLVLDVAHLANRRITNLVDLAN